MRAVAHAHDEARSSQISLKPLRLACPSADDDVVVHRNTERLRHLGDLLRHLDVGGGRGGVAGGVVVDEDEGARRQLQRALHDLAGIDRGMVDGARLLHLVGDEGVALVEEQEPEMG